MMRIRCILIGSNPPEVLGSAPFEEKYWSSQVYQWMKTGNISEEEKKQRYAPLLTSWVVEINWFFIDDNGGPLREMDYCVTNSPSLRLEKFAKITREMIQDIPDFQSVRPKRIIYLNED